MAWFIFAVLVTFHGVLCSTVTNGELSHEHNAAVTEKGVFLACEEGWFPFGEKCYKLYGKKRSTKLTWENAGLRCSREGGTLATVDSQELHEFLVAFLLLDVKSSLWIGLHDRNHESVYEWADGTEFQYSRWAPLEPSGPKSGQENCVEMVFYSGKGKIGDWNDVPCNYEKAYICQTAKRERRRKTPEPMFCADNGRGWKFQESCFNLISENKTWTMAEKHCQTEYEGHLVATKDFTVDLFLQYILRNYTKKVWIGIKIREEWQQVWSSGWHVAYNGWEEGKKNFIEGTCVSRVKLKQWDTVSCSRKLGFICERSTEKPPALKPPLEELVCPETSIDWRDLGGEFCYYFEYGRSLSWSEANFMCMKRGGKLVSIHSKEEVTVLQQFVKDTQRSYFIGLHRSLAHEEAFAWADETKVDFEMWQKDEPSTNAEECVEMLSSSMEWNDVKCGEKRNYICSAKKIRLNATAAGLQQMECQGGISLKTLLGVVLCAFLIAALLGIVMFHFRPCEKEQDRLKKLSMARPLFPLEQQRNRAAEIIIKEEPDYEHVA